jgi:hypothetical protein
VHQYAGNYSVSVAPDWPETQPNFILETLKAILRRFRRFVAGSFVRDNLHNHRPWARLIHAPRHIVLLGWVVLTCAWVHVTKPNGLSQRQHRCPHFRANPNWNVVHPACSRVRNNRLFEFSPV